MRSRTRYWVVAGLAVIVAGGWLAFGRHSDTGSGIPQVKTVQTTNPGGTTNTQKYIETSDFKYIVPEGWVELDKNALDRAAASSGIGRLSSYPATFRTQIDVLLSNDTDLKTQPLNIIKKNAPNFKQISVNSTTVDKKAGQQFVYTFTDNDGKNKVRQQLSAVPVKDKDKTFLLLFSSPDDSFDKQSNDFKTILDSFKFK